jgi:transposase
MGTNGSSDAGNTGATTAIFVGIDVAKDELDLARSDAPGVVTTATNDPAGIARLVDALLRGPRPACIVVESTGGLERPLVQALLDAGLPVALVHPRRVRHFAKALGIESKTDRIDAGVLTRFAEVAAPRLLERRGRGEIELRDLVACRRQLTAGRAQQLNRRASACNKVARACTDAVIAAFDRQIDKLDRRVRELIDADDDFKDLDRRLRSIPGIGHVAGAALLAELPELGRVDRRQAGALVGVAPFPDDSGRKTGVRRIRGGRTHLRCVLYMCTLAAMRFNPVIRQFARRLTARGKKGKVVVVACMRKLLSLINAMVRDGLEWNQLDVVKKLAPNP